MKVGHHVSAGPGGLASKVLIELGKKGSEVVVFEGGKRTVGLDDKADGELLNTGHLGLRDDGRPEPLWGWGFVFGFGRACGSGSIFVDLVLNVEVVRRRGSRNSLEDSVWITAFITTAADPKGVAYSS
jgi:hypothetical protein